MTYAFTQDVPIDAAFYQRIVDGLGDAPPKGLITHIALERPEGGLRYMTFGSRKRTVTGSVRNASTRLSTAYSVRSSVTRCPKSPSGFLWQSSMSGVPSNTSS